MAGRAPAELLEDEKKHCQGLPVDLIPIARKLEPVLQKNEITQDRDATKIADTHEREARGAEPECRGASRNAFSRSFLFTKLRELPHYKADIFIMQVRQLSHYEAQRAFSAFPL